MSDDSNDLKEKEKDNYKLKNNFYSSIFNQYNLFPLMMSSIASLGDLSLNIDKNGVTNIKFLSISLMLLFMFLSHNSFRRYLKPILSALLSVLIFLLLAYINYNVSDKQELLYIFPYTYYSSYVVTYITAIILTYQHFKKLFIAKKYIYSEFYLKLLSGIYLLQITISSIYNFVFNIDSQNLFKFVVFVIIFIIANAIERKIVPYDANNQDK